MIRLLASLFGLVPSIAVLASDHASITSSDVTLAIGADGHVYSSGDAVDVRGDQRPGTRCHFEVVEGVSDIVSVDVCVNGTAAGALDRQGNVWLWGREWASTVCGKESGQHHVPAMHRGLSDIRSFSLADSNLIALKKDGRVVTAASVYNANDSGQMGTGDLKTPPPTGKAYGVVSVPGVNDAVAVKAGGEFHLILRSDGTVWGMGDASMLGEATGAVLNLDEEPRRFVVPKQMAGLKNIAAISAGHQFAIALDRSGQVWGWGLNSSGQLGAAVSDVVSIAPIKIQGFSRVTSIAAGYDFILAATDAGRVLAMGGNVYCALGDDRGELEGAKRMISKLSDVTEVFAGHYNGFAKTKSDELWGWGSNDRTIGGFHATSGAGFLPPTKVDVSLKPTLPSNDLKNGGVKLQVRFDLEGHFFESQKLEFTVGSKIVGTVELDETHDEQSFSLELPAGATRYSVAGTGTDDAGKVTRIQSQGVFMVSTQTVHDKFEAAVERDGLIAAVKIFKSRFDQAIADPSLPPVSFTYQEPLLENDLVEIEASLSCRLPASYRQAMKTIGPFRIGAPDSPHPRAALLLPDKDRNLLSYALAAERHTGDDAIKIDDTKIPPNDLFRDVTEQFGYMTDALAGSEAVKGRPSWKRGLIVGTSEESLYLLIAKNASESDQPLATLWAPFFRQEEDDFGNSRGLFQWATFASSETAEEVQQNLVSGVYQALFAEYASRGITPLESTATNELVYVIFGISNENEPEGDQPFQGTFSSDGW
ncbi:RCC1 domain-containing protein [Stieleria marina]